MKPVSELHFRVCDKGLFIPVALRLAREARKVTYWTPQEKAFPSVRDLFGEGFREIETLRSMWQDKDDVDCFVFPDTGFADEQMELVSQGIPVWGARQADEFELSRGLFLESLKQVGLPVPKHERVTGITALRDHLRERENVWIKTSRFRGDWETLHWRSWDEDENVLDQKAVQYGPIREKILFYVFDEIKAKVEDGVDTWVIDGKSPDLVIHGMEAKDQAYIGRWQEFSKVPEEVRIVNEKFVPLLAPHQYRSFFSTEVRITEDGESYFIDPTCRGGSPPSQIMTELIGNYAEVIWQGANGKVVEPEPAAKYGAQAILKVKGDKRHWLTMDLPYELERWVKPSNCMREGDTLCFPPDATFEPVVGWVVGIGDMVAEAITHLRHNIKALPPGVECDLSPLADLLKEVIEAEEMGMQFTPDPVPSPEIVLEDK